MGNGIYFPEAIDVIADVCRQTAGAELLVIGGAQTHGYGGYSFAPIGQMNHHTGPGGWIPLVNYCHHGHPSYPPLANGMTSNPWETGGKVIVAVTACGRANHAGRGVWRPDVGTDDGNRLLWGWEHHHDGSGRWHPLHREVILRLNVGLCLAFGWKVHNTPDHKDYAPGRKPDRAGEDTEAWRRLQQQRVSVGHISGHAPEVRKVSSGRTAGEDRFETAARMMRKAYDAPQRVMYVVATESSEERLSAHHRAPVALVTRDSVPAPTKALIRHFKPDHVEALGGNQSVSAAVLDQCKRIAEQA